MLYIYNIICVHALNYIGREKKEAISVQGGLVVIQLYTEL